MTENGLLAYKAGEIWVRMSVLLGVKSDQIRHYLRTNDDQLLQFSRHMLPDFDVAGQERLLQSKVLLIELGALVLPSRFIWAQPA